MRLKLDTLGKEIIQSPIPSVKVKSPRRKKLFHPEVNILTA